MKGPPLPSVLAALGRAATSAESDATLLGRFASAGDQAAFAELTRRYARLVWRVARTRCRTAATAEDVFQATFVVLAKKAGTIRPSGPLAGWLHRTAHRLAVRATRRERPTAPLPADPPVAADPLDALSARELLAAVDDEMAGLPDVERAVLALCGVEDLSLDEAATRLGWSVGSVKGRLERARAKLRSRLDARGLTLPAVVVGLIGMPSAGSVRAAAAAALGGAPRPAVTHLIAEGLSMKLRMAKAAGLMLIGVAMMTAGIPNRGAVPGATAAPVPKELKVDAGLLWVLDPDAGQLVAYTPDGSEAKTVRLPGGKIFPSYFAGLSADGRFALLLATDGKMPDPNGETGVTPRLTLHLLPLHEPGELTDTGINMNLGPSWAPDTVCTSPDGGFIYRCRHDERPKSVTNGWVVTRFDRTGKNAKEIELPEHLKLAAVLPNGDFLLNGRPPGREPEAYRWTPGDPKPVLISGEVDAHAPSLSPDEKTLLATSGQALFTNPPPGVVEKFKTLVSIDPSTGKEVTVLSREKTWDVTGWWSPDGRRIAVQWHEWMPEPPLPPGVDIGGQRRERRAGGGEVVVCKPDGSGEKVILKLEDPGGGDPVAFDLRHRKHLLGWFPGPQQIKAPVPKAKDAGLIWTHHTGTNTLTALTPDGREARRVQLAEDVPFYGFTPGGAQMAFGGVKGKAAAKKTDGLTLHVGDIDESGEGADTGLQCFESDRFVWSPDGRAVVRAKLLPIVWGAGISFEHTLYDLGTRKTVTIDLPAHHEVTRWSADGTTWYVKQHNEGGRADAKLPRWRWHTATADAKPKLTPICDEHSFQWLEPDAAGATFLGTVLDTSRPGWATHLYRVTGGKAERLAEFDGIHSAVVVRSPADRRVVCVQHVHTRYPDEGAARLVLLDPDGTNETKLLTVEKDAERTRLVGWFPTPQQIKAPVPKAAKDDGLIWAHNTKTGVLTAYTADGKVVKELALKDGTGFLGLTPDGKQILFAGRDGRATNTVVAKNLTLHLRGLTTDETGTDTGLECRERDQFVFSPDGRRVIRQRQKDLGQAKPVTGYVHVLFDRETKTETPIDVPPTDQITRWSADGKSWLAIRHNTGEDPKAPHLRWLRHPAGGGEPTPVCDAGSFHWLEPDGNAFIGVGEEFPAAARRVERLFRVAGGQAEVLTTFDGPTHVTTLRRSPDGMRVVYAKVVYDGRVQRYDDTALVVVGADGKGERTLLSVPGDEQQTRLLGWFPTPADLRR